MPPKWSPKPREVYRVDLKGAIHDQGFNATHRVCVVIEVHDDDSMTVVFGSSDYHFPGNCRCIEPGSEPAKPFGDWLIKTTHFSAYNVVKTPVNRIVKAFNTQVTPDEWEALDVIAVFAYVQSKKRTIN